MTSPDGLLHSKLPPGAVISGRDTGALIGAEDVEQISPEFIAAGMLRIREALSDLARQTENHSNPVDEYNSGSLTGGPGTTSQLTIQPTYEYMPEKILAIVVTGPPAAAFTLTLGDRLWSLVLPASGILPIGPLALILSRNDARQLTAQTPGAFTLELMGFADARFHS